MLQLTAIDLYRGIKPLLTGADLTLNRGQRLGLVGANGCGKSTLFALIRGELECDAGELSLQPGCTIAHVAQEIPQSSRTAIDWVIDGDHELRQIEMALDQADGDGHHIAELHARHAAIDGYTARARAARLLHGLGFLPGSEERPTDSFSGGWQMRINLARALMARSDLLLLDEPTNHLDLEAVLWLEEWLRGYDGALMLISHDRDFLDRVVDRIAHIEQQRLNLYSGNYSDFERMRSEQLRQQTAAHRRQQAEIAQIQGFIDRFRAKATKARQAQSRIKTLERLERIAPAHTTSPFHFSFAPPDAVTDPLLQLEKVTVGYGERRVVSAIDLRLTNGDRIGVVGANGAGKSTLIKLLADELSPLSGNREEAPGLTIGYFAQHQLDLLDPDASPLLHLQRIDPTASEQALRNFLGGFDFNGDAALAPVAPLSGGEKARLVLAMIVYRRPALLLLDEPTNHLDLEMRHALGVALQGFDGALVLVSHDRALLRDTCDSLLQVEGGQITPFDGDIDRYREWLAGQRRTHKEDSGRTTAAPDRREQRRLEAEQRQRLAPLRRQLTRLEERLNALTERQQLLEERLADPQLYEGDEPEELQQLLREQGINARETGEVEEEWLLVSEQLDSALSEDKGEDSGT